ncbi:uncharacterized protein LOC129914533 isoform X4 [Episyrphus balteatus]|uniref:uncharacterized protein LOC129914533 isoform X4 n=1 Tax=Episyrphus balteatus TaxID=286459 RepID=UPI0024850087|nr:uncharacterized protein LOC129914533 isoform X4 [Episyrphus balteatus]
MDSKKLQQLQQANSHLAPQKKVPLSYQTNIADYRTSAHSPVFQNHHLQYHGGGSGGSGGGHQSIYQQQQQQSPSSSGSQLTPIDMQPQGKHNMLKTTAYHQQQFTGEQIYQTPPERTYQMSAAAGRPLYQTASSQLQHNPVTALQQQYQQLQQAKIQAQIQTQNEALVQQQRTFAMRQALNPPVPQGHYHMSQSSSLMSSPQQQQSPHHQSAAAAAAASSHRTVPPSTLNLSSQFQPAPGPLKVAPNTNKHFHQDQASLYAQQQHQLQLQLQLQQQQQQLQQQQQQKQNHQLLSNQHSLQDNGQSARQKPAPPLKSSDMSGITPGSEPSPVYIQQNHPGHVVNQACQTQLSGALGNKTPAKTPSSEDSSNKSPSGTSTSAGQHSQLDRKKSSGSIQALKSPITKRPPTSPVAMSGWLYKQGSDGLKVWRKRWFVLAEYCLYYYKGPEEEKLLGSILLPSYKVSACLPEDKIYRKYAFKCEHTNMRTYWLAAETAEAMIQWVRALTAATMMQVSSESDQTSQPSVSSLNQSADNSDSGIHTLQSQQSKMSLSQGPVTPASDNGAQPLYANAPPKPRRINDGGYSSPSPEHSVDNEGSVGRKHGQNQQQPSSARRSNTVMSPSLQQMQRSQHHAIYDSRTGNVTSSLRMQSSADNLANQMQQINMDANRQSPYHSNDYSAGGSLPQNIPGSGYNHQGVDLEEQLMRMPSRSIGDDIYGERELYMQKIIQQRYPPNQAVMGGYASAERRTPDAYGRSKNRPFSDYEDIYNLTQQCKTPQPQEMAAGVAGGSAYRRPMSPPTYDSTKHVPPMPSRYTPNHLESTTGSSTNLRTRPSTASIIRPHSADFLEYEARVEAAAAAATSSSTGGAIKPDAIRAPRPKSSLDINRAPDSFYYSEASYAEKMRQSALYLQSPQTAQPQQQQQQQQHHLQQQQQPPPPAPASAYGYTAAYPSPSGMHTIGYENPYERAYKRNELLQEATINQGTSSVPRMSRGVSNSAISKDIIGSGIHLRPQHHHQGSQQLPSQHEQFLRSASARLPRNRDEDAPSTPTSSLQDGERKREESMKRLLEWKQRMLQSPLTRKGMQQSGSATLMTKLGSNPNILAAGAANNPAQQHPSSGVVAPHNLTIGNGSASGANGAVVVGGVSGIQRSRSETHANAGGYNSFSSDDEASISVRNVRNIPKVNLTVKPDPSDQMLNYEQISKLASSYYGNAMDAKYAKTTQLATERDRNNIYGLSSTSTPMAGSTSAGITMDFRGSSYDINAANAYREANGYHPMRRVGSRAEIDLLERETSSQMRNLDVSAGDLLSRTHEELVLLLIQLRRQNSNTARAIEQCCTDIHEIQNRIRTAEGLTRAESIQRLDYLKQHLLDLERQYEKSKPLVNLVDNMVKLGSLYRSNDTTGRLSGIQRPESVTLDRLEFNQRVQERRMLQEEQKQWDRLSPNHTELQSKVRQLYQLDQLLQEESGTLQNLQRDKEDLERALGGLRARIHDSNGTPMVLEAAKKQQHILEAELSRVHQLLAENSKKLEQTVAGNARLEQELLVLRQKLQASRGSQNALNPIRGESMQYASSTTALLESELKRVQQLVGDMQRQRQELSQAVRQLTENSNRLYQEIGNKEGSSTPTASSHIKKRTSSTCWIETDLDSMVSVDRTVNDTPSLSTPLYVDTSSANSSVNVINYSGSSKHSEFDDGGKINRTYRYQDSDPLETSGVDSDGFLDTNPFANLSNQEKQEIKTVRIVKRESERRHRDRERSTTTSTQNLDQVQEEEHHQSPFINEDYQARSKSLPRTYTEPPKLMPKVHKNHSGSRQSIKYTDYYSNSPSTTAPNNPYMVSMSDRNCNVYPFHHQQQQQQQQQQQSSMPNGYHSKSRHYHHQQPPPPAPPISIQHALRQKTESMQSLNKSISDLNTVFQSEAARQIMNEMSAGSASEDNTTLSTTTQSAKSSTSNTEKVPSSHKHRRAVPREKRRHYTAPNNVNAKAMENVQAENDMNRNNTNWRARDDLDMEVALRPRINAPDVVRSALGHGEKISENTIDNLLLAPNKIVIPERYIPETTPELSPEEKKRRQEKVEVIKKMLSDAPINSSNDTVNLPPSKINAEKKQREHLLQLNQILAQQVMQMSKIVADEI